MLDISEPLVLLNEQNFISVHNINMQYQNKSVLPPYLFL